jgi:hypothetical protein
MLDSQVAVDVLRSGASVKGEAWNNFVLRPAYGAVIGGRLVAKIFSQHAVSPIE